MERLRPRLDELQEQLFADGRKGGTRSVLLVLQGLDTSGKGGTVRHVVGQMDPQGVSITSFGPPTPRNAATTSYGGSAAVSPSPASSGSSTAPTTRTS